ncbi:DsbA family oxidoreductase, partial [Limimaricola soesokkakensis]|uniref:DsbA family oxidoreductase n=1 Tax=Limimaricola soesokkakensis TaxID=1343159 RepID=UPI00351759B9
MSEPIRVDIVSDVVCPWCVIGYSQLARAAEEIGIAIEIHWHPFELNPQMAEEGENLREHLAAKYGTSPEDSVKARARLTEMGAALGFTFDYADDMRMVNTFRAHRLIDWATEQGRGHEMNLALFEAFFTRR